MNETLIKDTLRFVDKQEGQKHPCSNQSVRKIIYVKQFDETVEKYLENIGATMWNRKDNFIRKIDIGDEKWIALAVNQMGRGFRAYEAKVDSRIDDYSFQAFVSPQLSTYCHKVEFF